MEGLFLKVINLSITGTYIILFILLARLLLKWAPKIFSYLLWTIVFIRLIFPISFESTFSLMRLNSEPIPEEIGTMVTPSMNSGVEILDVAVNSTLPVAVPTASVNPMQIWIFLGSVVWIVGIILILSYSIYSTVSLSRRLKGAVRIDDNVYEIFGMKTAFVFGILNPKIYLPTGLSEEERALILTHERVHIDRRDPIFKIVAFLISTIHWFNPFVWLSYNLMIEDMELSCDDEVLKRLGKDVKKNYSQSLLSLSSEQKLLKGSPIAFGENNTKARIKNVLSFREPKSWILLICILVVAALGFGLLTNYKNSIETGVYENIQEDGRTAFFILGDDNKYLFMRSIATSYLPEGKYEIKGDELILLDPGSDDYIFKIEGDKFIFQGSAFTEALVPYGGEFKLVEPKDYTPIHKAFLDMMTKNK